MSAIAAVAETETRTSRLFAALPLPDAAVSDLAEVVSELNIARRTVSSRPNPANRRLVSSGQWHVTMAFLGEVDTARVDEVVHALGTACQAIDPLRICVSGGGRFGRGRYSVVYAGLDGDVAPLVQLVHRIRAGLTKADFPVDQKQYRPHVTLARPGDRVTNQQAAQDLLTLRRYHGPSWTARDLVLYRNDFAQKPSGGQPGGGTPPPNYTVVSTLPLGPA